MCMYAQKIKIHVNPGFQVGPQRGDDDREQEF